MPRRLLAARARCWLSRGRARGATTALGTSSKDVTLNLVGYPTPRAALRS